MKDSSKKIRSLIFKKCDPEGLNVASAVARELNLSKQSVARHLKKLEDEGLIQSTIKGRMKTSKLITLVKKDWAFKLVELHEDRIWNENIKPLFSDLPENVQNIWHYGITEMINNAIDHSEGKTLKIFLDRNALNIKIWIVDNGEGIFHRIQRLAKLYDTREAILELSKGKFTTDPSKHSGEGIFFTSRSFDYFEILSRNLFFSHDSQNNDWLLDRDSDTKGTTIFLQLTNDSHRKLNDIFSEFMDSDFTFSKTIIPVNLARHEGEVLMSRSQAKRLVFRFEKFKEIVLDFKGVKEIGQAFADQIFRVFTSSHPNINLTAINTTQDIKNMISRVTSYNQ